MKNRVVREYRLISEDFNGFHKLMNALEALEAHVRVYLEPEGNWKDKGMAGGGGSYTEKSVAEMQEDDVDDVYWVPYGSPIIHNFEGDWSGHGVVCQAMIAYDIEDKEEQEEEE